MKRQWYPIVVLVAILAVFLGRLSTARAEEPKEGKPTLMWFVTTQSRVSIYDNEEDETQRPHLFLEPGSQLLVMAFKPEGDDVVVCSGNKYRVFAMGLRTHAQFCLAGRFNGRGWISISQFLQQLDLLAEKAAQEENKKGIFGVVQASYKE